MSYIRPAENEWQEEVEIKKSRFIGLARQASSEEEARDFIDTVRARFPDARHHCSGYIIRQGGAQPVERSSDDGEPAGTAGQPILEVIRGTSALDVVVVVVRYFGGVLLGTGGLVRAYQDGTRAVLDKVKWVQHRQLDLYRLELEYSEAGRMESEIRNAGYQVLETSYGKHVDMVVVGDDHLEAAVASLSAGKLTPKPAGQRWVDVELPPS